MVDIEVSPLLCFDIVLRFRLENNALIAELDCSHIEAVKNYPISSISFLEYFGAVTNSKEDTKDGFLLLNDGSGCIVDLAPESIAYSLITTQTYGEDAALGRRRHTGISKDLVWRVKT